MADAPLDARELGRRSRGKVLEKDKTGWLELFADDAIVSDPIGPSPFDPSGDGHVGKEAIGAFYDNVIAANERVEFVIDHEYLCGKEAAAVGKCHTILPGGAHMAVVYGVFTYKDNGHGKLQALRAYWEFDTVEVKDVEK